MRTVRLMFLMSGVAMLLATAREAEGANCALRNPDRQIYAMFPGATSYRSAVANVDSRVKPAIEKALGNPISFTDLGKHTIYLVLRHGVPIGFVHARSEIGKRGSVELVWAMDLDLMIKDFRVQRSREKYTDVIKSAAFRDHLVGKDLEVLRRYLTDGNTAVDLSALQIGHEMETIAHTVVLCGAKTRIITDIAFRDSVFRARLLGNVHRFFPKTEKATQVSSGSRVVAIAAVRELGGTAPDQIDPESLTILRALGKNGETLGLSVFSKWSAHPSSPETWWAVSRDGVIQEIVVVGELNSATRRKFASLRGKSFEELATEPESSRTSPARLASQVLAVLAVHKIRK